MAVKEWRESGRRGGREREGQFRKERDVKEGERDLNAVEESVRSVEQFVKERDVTSLNGEVEEQVTVMEEVRWLFLVFLLLLLQGSLRVGMLRDSRA